MVFKQPTVPTETLFNHLIFWTLNRFFDFDEREGYLIINVYENNK